MGKYRPPKPKYKPTYRPKTTNQEKLPEVPSKQPKQTVRRVLYRLADLINPIILLGYCFITILTPRMQAFDSGGTKFLALAVLNLLAFFFLLLREEQRPPLKIFSSFFNKTTGLLYGLFLAVSLLSFVKAVNPAESLLAFTKLFTVFTAAMIIAAILRVNKKFMTLVAVSMSLLLMADAAGVFYQMYKLVENYPSFTDLYLAMPNEVKHGYSNKNILSSAIFVKIPFALWLWSFKKNLVKILGLAATFAGVIALMPVSSRAFYVGLAILTVVYLVFIIIRFFVDRKRWKTAAASLIIVALIPLFIYLGWLGLSRVFPTVQSFNLKDKITARLGTIKQDVAAGTRIASWGRSVKLIKEEPLLGVGAGNWKINVLKYENQTSPDYIYYYYNHNDFIQTTAETGIIGGLLFLSIFIGVGWAFLKALFNKPASLLSNDLPATGISNELIATGASGDLQSKGASYEYLFIPAFGLLCYSVDASFNFPFDRPEIQSLWAIFLGAAVAFSPEFKRPSKLSRFEIFNRQRSRAANYILPTFMTLLLTGSIWLLYLNFRSLQLEGVIKGELAQGFPSSTSARFIEGFPAIPNLSIESEPIAVMKSRYLFNEGKFDEAIELLKKDNPSPWESRREYFLSIAYERTGKLDSAIAYCTKVFSLKPLYTANIDRLCKMLEFYQRNTEAADILEAYGKAAGSSPQNYIDWQTRLRQKATTQQVGKVK